jgi:hypothetical protein
VSILVTRGNSSGLSKNFISLVVSRVPPAWGCCAGGGADTPRTHVKRSFPTLWGQCTLEGHGVVVVAKWASVVLVLYTRNSVEVACWVSGILLFCWRGSEGKSFDFGGLLFYNTCQHL